MPGRKTPLVTGEVYHVVNRGIASRPIFFGKKSYERAFEITSYYRNKNIPLRYSFFLRQLAEKRKEILDQLEKEKEYIVDLISYCLMPNHFHFLLKQTKENGISEFMSNFSNSYTRYHNTKQKITGPIFQGKFKAVRIETDEQLVHVSRYIHLNPFTSIIVKRLEDLEHYPYFSLSEYLNPDLKGICNRNLVLGLFKNNQAYREFVFAQADYQRELDKIKHLTLEA